MKAKQQTSSSLNPFWARLLKLAGSVILCICMLSPAMAQEQAVESSFPGNMNEVEFALFLAMGGLIFLTLLIVVVFFYVLAVLKLLKEEKNAEAASSMTRAPNETQSLWTRLNLRFGSGKLLPVEKEKEIMLDHEYDGISELNNSMPPWLKYLFYLTIGFAVVYVLHYLVLDTGKLQLEEYQDELALAEVQAAARTQEAGSTIDENNVTLITDEAALKDAAAIYAQNCAACHGADGGGTVGPNLTDAYWLHGGSLKDVFKVIKYGVQEKGMIPWEDKLNPEQIQKVASFVISLQGTSPKNPKDPQGDKFEMEEIATAVGSMK